MTPKIADAGRQLVREEVESIERELGAPLPNQYVRFVLANNGGVPTPNTIDIDGLPGSPTDVQEFFGIGLEAETSNAMWYFREVPDRLPPELFPFACDSGGNLFCIVHSGDNAGRVVYLDLASELSPPYVISEDFSEFLAKIR